MVNENVSHDPGYQREMNRYQLLLRKQGELVHGTPAARKAASEALDLQMMRLQAAELRWQAAQLEGAPQQVAAICDETRHFLAKSRSVMSETHQSNEKLLTQIADTRAVIAESQKLLDSLK
jgi:hypothetical protein